MSEDDNNENEEKRELYRSLGFLSTVGISMAAAIFIGFGMGYYIDKYLNLWFGIHTKPVFSIIFTIFGIVAGFKNLFKLIGDKK